MATLLQMLLISTLSSDTDPTLRQFIDTVLPSMEQEFSSITALGGSYEVHLSRLKHKETAKRWSEKADQSLLVHVLNGLLTAWNLIPFLDDNPLNDDEKRLLCLGLTLHDYNKYCQGEEKDSPKAYEVDSILALCQEMGKRLNFGSFWPEWKSYLSEIGFLAQNTQRKHGSNLVLANWPNFKLRRHRLLNPLRLLLTFGDVAVHMTNPAEVITTTRGDRLQDCLDDLCIPRKLVYHRLRDVTGILSNGIHNAVLAFTKQEKWQPILYFAQGAVYLAPQGTKVPESEKLKSVLWNAIEKILSGAMLGGNIGFKRDGKGVKVSPQTLELFSPEQLIRGLPEVITAKVRNDKAPATPKRLASLELSESELERLAAGSDIRSDQLAELIGLVQKEFFSKTPEFTPWVLEQLKIQDEITTEQTQVQKGGVNYGWYRAAAEYVLKHQTLDTEQFAEMLGQFSTALADWAIEKQLLPETVNSTKDAFLSYLDQYLEISGWDSIGGSFQQELERYTIAKTKASKQPICSLSSGEFISEDQMDSVVLFKPQQYSNKNPLGGGQIKRGISKIWSLEMLLRQSKWAVPPGKMEDQNPIFLYMYPAYVYSPQVAQAVRVFAKDLRQINFWELHKFWINHNLDIHALHQFPWLSEPDPEEWKLKNTQIYGSTGPKQDLPFLGISYTTTRGKTHTDAWAEPAFLSLVIAKFLGIKVVATASQTPLYRSDSDFRESIKLDGLANFWSVLNLPDAIHLEEHHQGRIQRIEDFMQRLLIAYSVHLENQADKPDPRWRALPDTVRQLMSNVLNLFSLAESGCRKRKRDPTPDDAQRYWKYAQLWSQGDAIMEEQISLVKRLAQEYRQFYKVRSTASSHAILLPLTKALDTILSVPPDLPEEDLILEGAGQLKDALERQEVYTRPLLLDKSKDIALRKALELQAIQQFMTTCVEQLFKEQYQKDIALLQENRNRIKSGVEFAYLMLNLEDIQQEAESETETESAA
ncbi:type I-D CRISPR-associated protein Cas10d/Csc3 [Leptothoe sp. LEGE 181152]|nr:type I-D CRISPR-associated protein Cas10d/Csc3 [Leptothoe sp. LEGE 181152]